MSLELPSLDSEPTRNVSGESDTRNVGNFAIECDDEEALVMEMLSALPTSILEVLETLHFDEARKLLELDNPIQQFLVHDMTDLDRWYFVNVLDEAEQHEILKYWVGYRVFSKISAFNAENDLLIKKQIQRELEDIRILRATRDALQQLVAEERDSATPASTAIPGLKYEKSSRRLIRDGEKYRHVTVVLTPSEAELFEAICNAGCAGLPTARFRALTNSSHGSQDQNKATLNRKLKALEITIPNANVTHVYLLKDLAQQDR